MDNQRCFNSYNLAIFQVLIKRFKINNKRLGGILNYFKAPDRESVNPSSLGDKNKALGLKWKHERYQARKPYELGLQMPLGIGDEIPLCLVGWRCWPVLS